MKLYAMSMTCSRAPHIVLEELGIPFELHHVDLLKGEGQTPEYLQNVNPIGAVPVLEIAPDHQLREAQVILQYLADQHPEKGLAPAYGTTERYELMQWLSFISTELHKSFFPLFFASRMVSDPTAQEELKKNATQRLEVRWAAVSDQLRNSDYLLGDYTIADAYLYTVLGWAKMLHLDLSRWSNLERYQQRMENRPAVRKVLNKEQPVTA